MPTWRKVIVAGSNAELNHISSSGNFVPVETDGGALGSAGLNWSDLFLDSGAVINFDGGDVTLTHSSNKLTVDEGDLVIGEGFDVSGSFTSTGSFGSLILASSHPRIQGNISIEGTLGVGTGQSTALHLASISLFFLWSCESWKK